MWICSSIGLTRYDGFEYKTYHSNSQTSYAGSNIKEDKYGRIWYENFDGYIYYIENDSLKALDQKTPIGYIPFGVTKNHIFLLQKKGIVISSLSTLKTIKTINKVITSAESAIADDRNFFCILENTIYKIDENLKVTSSNYFINKIDKTKQIYCTDSLIYVVSKYNECSCIYIFDKNLNFKRTLSAPEPHFIQGLNVTNGLLWINTPNGSHGYSHPSNNADKCLTVFKNKSISTVTKDRQNNYWFTTTNEGIFLVPDLKNKLYSLSNYIPNKIIETKNEYFIATKKSELICCDKNFNIKHLVNKKTDNSEIYYLHYDSLTNDLFYSSKGFTKIPDLNTKKIKFSEIAVKEIIKLDEKYYAFASSGICGLVMYNENAKSVKSFWDSYYQKHLIEKKRNEAVLLNNVRGKSVAYNSNKKIIYFAANTGLYRHDSVSNTEIKHHNTTFHASKILCYKNSIYALSTKGNLYKIENDTNFHLLNEKLNINENEIKLIKQFNNMLLIASSQSIHKLDLETNEVVLLNINVNPYEISDLLLKNEVLYILSTSGIIKTDLANQNQKRKKALLQLNELIINDKKYDLLVKNRFNYNQNDLLIDFSILDFGTISSNELNYRINEDKWKLIANETRYLQFAKLSPGDYKIEFKLNNTLTPTFIEFTILPPFWKTGWFIIASFLILLLLGYSYYRWQLLKLRNKNKLLEDKNTLLQEKMELEHNLNKSVLTSIKSQMNPHFFYNALNTIQAFIFTNDKSKANSYLAKFSKLTRVILEQSEKEAISLTDEIESLTLYLELEKMRFKESFEYSLNTSNLVNKEQIELPPMLIQPYVENAVKHGLLHKEGDRELEIKFERSNSYLIVSITDNGIGRKRSAELNKIKNEKYKSFSTQANEKRLEILNKGRMNKVSVEITDNLKQDGTSSGTTVKLTIPIT